MQSYAIIDENGVVTNVVLWDGETEWEVPEWHSLVKSDHAAVGWSYKDGQFAPPPIDPATAWLLYQAKARQLLADSEEVVMLCYESGIPMPRDWSVYRKALRAIIGASTGDVSTPLPQTPERPAEI